MSQNRSPSFDVSALVKDIDAYGNQLSHNGGEARAKCLAAARQLCFALETPAETVLRVRVAEQAHHAVLRTAIDLHVFEKMAKNAGHDTSSAALAELTGCDHVLMSRLLKHLAAMGTLYESEADMYCLTPFSSALAKPQFKEAIPLSYDVIGPSFSKLHAYLAENDYKNPQESLAKLRYDTSPLKHHFDGPFQYAHKTTDDFWSWIAQRPEPMCPFNSHMNGRRLGVVSSIIPESGLRPAGNTIVNGGYPYDDDDDVLVVSVGGGKGHDLNAFRAQNPAMRGRLILQDKFSVIEKFRGCAGQGVSTMEHDIFSPQPVKGARAYFLHSVLHDWSDEKCLDILANLKPAMTKGYSKLLITEHVVSDKGADWMTTSFDMLMMCCFSTRERTEKEWKGLLGKAGFKVNEIFRGEPGTESLIEAELA